MTRFQWIFIVVVMSSNATFCQRKGAADSTTVLAGVTGDFGSILPHSSQIAHLAGPGLWGVQAEVARIRYTQTSWDACNCYSRNGLSLSYFNFGNPEVLGSAISLALFAEPQLTYGRINLSLRAGAGISYLTRVYDPDQNPQNLFFSDPWSGLLLAQATARYPLSSTWHLRMGASYSHISNGGKRQPNKGMNFPTVGLGVDYLFKGARPLSPRTKRRLSDRSIQYYAGLFYNTRAVDESKFETEERKTVIGLHGGFYKPISLMHGIGLAIEAAHDGALKAQSESATESFDHHVISLLAGHHFLFGRFDFSQALGFYLHKDYPTPEAVFQRYGLSLLLFRHLEVGFSLKAHLYTAEQMDLRVRVRF